MTATSKCCATAIDQLQLGQEGSATIASVKKYYGEVLTASKDLKTNACTAAGRPHDEIVKHLRLVPQPVKDKFYGCGAPLPLGIQGRRVLDLGCGSGRDCYVCAAMVGESGTVTGIDMTDEQLSTALAHVDEFTHQLGYSKPNLRFVKGYIEHLDRAGVPDESQDLVISNCVINLSPDKPRVLSEAYRVLAVGGELYFSDVYCDRRLPEAVRKHEVLWGECIAGALYVEDFKRLAHSVGFADPRTLSTSRIEIQDPAIKDVIGEASFYSITYRLFKLPGLLESMCEDYGQVAIYKGTIPGQPHGYTLDDHHHFPAHKPILVCGNTAAMLGEGSVSWLSDHFDIVGNRDRHFGLFDCGPKGPASLAAAADAGGSAPNSGSCC